MNPLDTSAMITARAPAVNAPTIGMKPAKKVTTARTGHSGTPSTSKPIPIKMASTPDTIACVRMNPDSVFQERMHTSVRCQPAFTPTYLRSQGRKPSPSLRKKKVRISVSTSVVPTEAIAPMPEKTPEAIFDACPRSASVTCEICSRILFGSMMEGSTRSLTQAMIW